MDYSRPPFGAAASLYGCGRQRDADGQAVQEVLNMMHLHEFG
jgi:hypothetical protein